VLGEGKCHMYLQDEQEGRSGELSVHKLPFSLQADFGENLLGFMSRHVEDKKAVGISQHGFINGKL